MSDRTVDIGRDWRAYEQQRGVGLSGDVPSAMARIFGEHWAEPNTIIQRLRRRFAALSDNEISALGSWFEAIVPMSTGAEVRVPDAWWTDAVKQVAWEVQISLLALAGKGMTPDLQLARLIERELTAAVVKRPLPQRIMAIVCPHKGCRVKVGEVCGEREPFVIVSRRQLPPADEDLEARTRSGPISASFEIMGAVQLNRGEPDADVVLECHIHGKQRFRSGDLSESALRRLHPPR